MNTSFAHSMMRRGRAARAMIAGVVMAGAMLAGGAAFAQTAQNGYYEPIPYYGNNPFLFCTLGVPQDCWAPVNPATGAFVVTNQYCFNAYSAAMYARVCPHAFPHGLTGGLGQNAGGSGGAAGGVAGGASGVGGYNQPGSTTTHCTPGAACVPNCTPGEACLRPSTRAPRLAKPKPNCGHVYCGATEIQ